MTHTHRPLQSILKITSDLAKYLIKYRENHCIKDFSVDISVMRTLYFCCLKIFGFQFFHVLEAGLCTFGLTEGDTTPTKNAPATGLPVMPTILAAIPNMLPPVLCMQNDSASIAAPYTTTEI